VSRASRSGLAIVCTVLTGVGLISCAAPATDPLPAGARPVLFVHGYGEDPGVFDAMIEHLAGRGYPRDLLLAVELDPNDGSNVSAAEGPIAEGVTLLLDRDGADGDGDEGEGTVDIVAHSMGAVSSRWYATRLHPDRVRSLTTVVGANHGTDVLCGYPSAGALEMCPAFDRTPDHAVQATLNGTAAEPVDETPYGRGLDPVGVTPVPPQAGRSIRYTTVAVTEDAWIKPAASAALAGADELPGLPAGLAAQPTPGNLVFAGPTDHDAILSERP
jgi:pimeloyl-ACP methyl ester carboxylesterase